MRAATVALFVFLAPRAASADPMNCGLASYRPSVGMTAGLFNYYCRAA